MFWNEMQLRLNEWKAKGLKRALKVIPPKRAVSTGDCPLSGQVNFADNDYLGLSQNPALIHAAKQAADKYGVGSGASRLISGTSPIHHALEQKLAEFKQKESALVFGAGYMANVGILTALMGNGDYILFDKLCHASIIDGIKLSGAKFRSFPHRDYERLEKLLQANSPQVRTLIVTESVFSMDGDLADLKQLVHLKKKYEAVLMVDEAHSTGVFGANGRGLAESMGVEKDIDISMGTLSKAIGSSGGFVCGSHLLKESLLHFSRPFIYSTALPAMVMAAGLEAVEQMMSHPEMRESLWNEIYQTRKRLKELGFSINEQASPIIPLSIPHEESCLQIADFLLTKGIYIPAIRYPTVAKGKARLRLTVSLKHTEAEKACLFTALKEARSLL